MIKWIRRQPAQVKWMLALVVVLVICVVARWTWIRTEAGDAIRQRLEHFRSR